MTDIDFQIVLFYYLLQVLFVILQNFSILNYIITLRYIIQLEANNRIKLFENQCLSCQSFSLKVNIKSKLQFKQTNFQRLKHTIEVRQTEPYCLNCKHVISTKMKLQSKNWEGSAIGNWMLLQLLSLNCQS